MAKKKAAAQQQQFVDPDGTEWVEKPPKAVQAKVDLYIEALRAQNAAREETNTARDNAIAAMKEHGIARVRIDEGGKWLICEDVPKLRTEKIKGMDGEAA